MAQWRAASAELEAVRRLDLRQLTDEQALAAAETLLSLAADIPLPEERRCRSGLVDLQACLHGLKA